MDSFYLAFTVVFPLFVNMALGYGMYHFRLIDDRVTEVMNQVVFKIFLPILLFVSVSRTKTGMPIDFPLMAFAAISIISIFIVLCLLVPRWEKNNQRRGVIIQGIFRSNFVLFGLPVAISICGEDNVQPVAVLIAIVIPLFNGLAVLSLEMFKEEKINWSKIIKSVVTNPLILAAMLGVILLLLDIRLPEFISTSLNNLAQVATPLALIMLGASFRFSTIGQCWRQLLITVLGRLVFVPLIFLLLAIQLGFRDVELVGLLALFASPNAVSSFTMAVQMDCDGQLAGQIVVFTSIFSMITMFFWILSLKLGGFI